MPACFSGATAEAMTEPRRTLALFGASGATGRRIVAAALAEGFRVQALVRPGAAISPAPGDLNQITGSLDDAAALRATLGGAGAAAVVFGPRAPYTEVFCAEGTRRIVEAMQRAGIRRLICQTGAMVGDYPHNLTAPFRWLTRLNRWRAPAAAVDRRRQEEVVMRSGLDWTLVKPPRLTDGATGFERAVTSPAAQVRELDLCADHSVPRNATRSAWSWSERPMLKRAS